MKTWQSLRNRLIASYVLLAALLLGGFALVFSAAFASFAADLQRQRAGQVAAQIRTVATEAAASRQNPQQVLQRLQQLLPDYELSLVELPALRTFTGAVPLPPDGVFREGPGERGLRIFMSEAAMGRDNLLVPVPQADASPAYAIRAVRRNTSIGLQALYSRVLFTLTLALGLSLLLGWWLSRWLSRPIARLTEATAAVAGGDFLQTVPPMGTSELDHLARQFNAMVTRLKESFRSLASERDVARRFAADAAHELRTPVTALRTYEEVLSEHPERHHDLLPAMSRQIERIERIISGLTQIATISEGLPIDLAPHDLAGVVRGMVPGFQAAADEYGHTLALAGLERSLSVRLDPRLVELALTNLVDNACKYTPPGGQIAVALDEQQGQATITVADNGPGIAASDLPHLFHRFHRGVDTQAISGQGLGLSIVQAAVDRLGGRVDVESTPGEGSLFIVRLPVVVA